jgi:hypothetical protein
MNETSHLNICKNCGNHFSGNYCNNCRQSVKTSRITWKELFLQFSHAFFHANKGIIYTIKELLLHPGNTIRDYINGKRVLHFNPFLFLILIGGLSTLLYSSLNLNPPNEEIELEKIANISATLAHKFFAAIGFNFIILLTITDFIFYYKSGFNLPELIVSNAFQVGQIMVFSVIFLPLIFVQDYFIGNNDSIFDLRSFEYLVSIVFLFFTRYQFYKAKRNYYLITKIIIQLAIVYFVNDMIISYLIIFLRS